MRWGRKKEDEEFTAEIEREFLGETVQYGGPIEKQHGPSYPMRITQQPQEARVSESQFNNYRRTMGSENATLHFPQQLDTPQIPAHAATR